MSNWTNVSGVIDVSPIHGNTPRQQQYVLETILDHLPVVSGSESDMKAWAIKKVGIKHNKDFNELDIQVNNHPHEQESSMGWLILIHGELRDRTFSETVHGFINWLFRLAKNVIVHDILVRIYEGYNGNHGKTLIFDNAKSLNLVDENPIPFINYIPKWPE